MNQQAANHEQKMRIRGFPQHLDEDFIDELWNMLKNAFQEIQKRNNSGLSFEELYRNAYTLILHKKGDKLYNGLKDIVSSHLKGEVRDKIVSSINSNILQALANAWDDHQTSMVMIRDILMYMDRAYVNQKDLHTVYNLGLSLFREHVIEYELIRGHLRETLLDLVAKERRGEVVEHILTKNTCQMLITLGVNSRALYEEIFEVPFLSRSAEFYKLEGQRFLSENCAAIFLEKVERRLSEESERAKNYLDGESERKIVEVVERELILKHVEDVVEMESTGLGHMLKESRAKDIARMYRLFSRVPNGTEFLAQSLSKHLRETGAALFKENVGAQNGNANVANPITYIEKVIELKAKTDRLLSDAFCNDQLFKKTVSMDFEYFLNLDGKSPEYVSLYIDDKLKKGIKELSEQECDIILDKAIVIFKYLREKDLFERYYKQHLAKRLLLNKSANHDIEKSMITKLMNECGIQFTSKLDGMFRDISISDSLTSEYKSYVEDSEEKDAKDIDLSVRVLTTGFWPTQTSLTCALPLCAFQAFESFKKFYLRKRTGRQLTINPGLGNADLNAIFYTTQREKSCQDNTVPSDAATSVISATPRKHILNVSTYQMCVLMLFNERESISYEDIKISTAIGDRELERCLQSLAMGKHAQRVLTKNPKTLNIASGDIFSINENFTSKFTRVKIQTVSSRNEHEPLSTEVKEKVEEDRRHEIEAAIIRVMKARRVMQHNNLISEVTCQLKNRFMPSPLVIKKRLEGLIEREYLSRDVKDRKKYSYIA